MTRTECDNMAEKLRQAYQAANSAENAYRVAKANKFLQLSNPPEGVKKPTESVILSTIDADPVITALRTANQAAQAELDVTKMVFKAMLSATQE